MSGAYWTHQFNTTGGCSNSTGDRCCANCWARAMHERFGDGAPFSHVTMHPERLNDPLSDRKRKPRVWFVCNTSDLFDPHVDNALIAATFGVMAARRQDVFLVLTKCAERMQRWFGWIGDGRHHTDPSVACECGIHAANQGANIDYLGLPDVWPLPNVYMGVTVGTRDKEHRLDILRDIPASKRWWSGEPVLDEDLDPNLERIDFAALGCENPPKRRISNETLLRLARKAEAAGARVMIKQALIGNKVVHLPELDGKVWNERPAR